MSTFNQKKIVKDMIDKIKSGYYNNDQKIETERELMDQYGVSRTTIRNVISELILQRYVYRIPDTGVFVQKEIIRKTSSISGFTAMIKDSGRLPSTKINRFEKLVPNFNILEAMKLEADTEVYFMERLRYVDGKPFLYEHSYINPDLVKNLDDYDFEEESIYEVLKADYGINIHYLQELVSAVTVDGKISDFLYGTSTAYALKVEGVSYNKQNQVIEYGISYYNAEDFSFESVLVNVKAWLYKQLA